MRVRVCARSVCVHVCVVRSLAHSPFNLTSLNFTIPILALAPTAQDTIASRNLHETAARKGVTSKELQEAGEAGSAHAAPFRWPVPKVSECTMCVHEEGVLHFSPSCTALLGACSTPVHPPPRLPSPMLQPTPLTRPPLHAGPRGPACSARSTPACPPPLLPSMLQLTPLPRPPPCHAHPSMQDPAERAQHRSAPSDFRREQLAEPYQEGGTPINLRSTAPGVVPFETIVKSGSGLFGKVRGGPGGGAEVQEQW